MDEVNDHDFTVTLIGAGNVGYHLALALKEQGITIQEVYSRNLKKAQQVADHIGAVAVSVLTALSAESALYILAVKDDVIDEVAIELRALIGDEALVVHTSGASPSTLLAPHFSRCGVFYPLQSFSRDRSVDWTKLPICVYANVTEDRRFLLRLAHHISPHSRIVNDEQRGQLHLAAVFVNNFTNYCYHIGREITAAKQIPFELLLPLIQQTVDKIKEQPEGQKDPLSLQTGPAIRRDQVTVERHLRQLNKQFPQYRDLYILFTELIQRQNKKKGS